MDEKQVQRIQVMEDFASQVRISAGWSRGASHQKSLSESQGMTEGVLESEA